MCFSYFCCLHLRKTRIGRTIVPTSDSKREKRKSRHATSLRVQTSLGACNRNHLPTRCVGSNNIFAGKEVTTTTTTTTTAGGGGGATAAGKILLVSLVSLYTWTYCCRCIVLSLCTCSFNHCISIKY